MKNNTTVYLRAVFSIPLGGGPVRVCVAIPIPAKDLGICVGDEQCALKDALEAVTLMDIEKACVAVHHELAEAGATDIEFIREPERYLNHEPHPGLVAGVFEDILQIIQGDDAAVDASAVT